MNYRVFYVLSNEEINLDDFKSPKFKIAKNTNLKEIKLFFTEDMLKVLSKTCYKKVNTYKYMYGFAIEYNKNMLRDIKELFIAINMLFDNVDIVFDTGSKRYINNYEFKYYTKSIMPIDKLFNVDISSSKYKSEYKTIGLKTIGIDEIKMYSNSYYSYENYLKFKEYITHSIANNEFPLLMIKEECDVIDEFELKKLKSLYNNNLMLLYNKHLVDNYINFFNLFNKLISNNKFEFYLNNQKLNNLNELPNYKAINYLNFKNYFTSYKIVAKDITYTHLNIFYALKYL